EVDKAYVRALRILMEGKGYPMVASHDPRLVAIAGELAAAAGRSEDGYEHQMLYGIRAASRCGWRPRANVCGCMSPTAPSGTAITCVVWPSARRTCCSWLAPLRPGTERGRSSTVTWCSELGRGVIRWIVGSNTRVKGLN